MIKTISFGQVIIQEDRREQAVAFSLLPFGLVLYVAVADAEPQI